MNRFDAEHYVKDLLVSKLKSHEITAEQAQNVARGVLSELGKQELEDYTEVLEKMSEQEDFEVLRSFKEGNVDAQIEKEYLILADLVEGLLVHDHLDDALAYLDRIEVLRGTENEADDLIALAAEIQGQ